MIKPRPRRVTIKQMDEAIAAGAAADWSRSRKRR
jgi:hypothetical protein